MKDNKPEYVVDMGELDWTPEERRKTRHIVATERHRRASRETTREAYTKKIPSNPRFKEAPKSGKGFVIGGAKRA